MVPTQSFLQDISSCLFAIIPENFYDKVEEGSIIFKQSQSFSFCEEGIMIDGETEPIRSDLVILATGFRGDLKLKEIFASSMFRDYMTFHDLAAPMYRLVLRQLLDCYGKCLDFFSSKLKFCFLETRLDYRTRTRREHKKVCRLEQMILNTSLHAYK